MPPGESVSDLSNFCVAHALQYNLCAVGTDPEEAVAKVVDLVIGHCRMAEASKISPVSLAEPYLLEAFFIGVRVISGAEQ